MRKPDYLTTYVYFSHLFLTCARMEKYPGKVVRVVRVVRFCRTTSDFTADRKREAQYHARSFWYLPHSLSLDLKFKIPLSLRLSDPAKNVFVESAEDVDCADDQPLTLLIPAAPSFTQRPVPNCASAPHLPSSLRAQQLTQYVGKLLVDTPCSVDAAPHSGPIEPTDQRLHDGPLRPLPSAVPSLSLAITVDRTEPDRNKPLASPAIPQLPSWQRRLSRLGPTAPHVGV